MADRDLLNKPLPLVIPEDRNTEKRGIPAPLLGKLGVQVRAREVGTEADAPKTAVPVGGLEDAESTPRARGKGAPQPLGGKGPRGGQTERGRATEAPRDAAFKAAYFNRDVGSTAAPNLRARPMAALRGEEGATDLKRVVLPPPSRSDAPQPEQLGGAMERMLPEEGTQASSTAPSLQGLVARQNAWTQTAGMTVEKLLQRLAELEALVATRKAALERLVLLTPKHLQKARTLAQAIVAEGEDPSASATVVEDADALVQQSHHEAQGLHLRLKKVMGIKGK